MTLNFDEHQIEVIAEAAAAANPSIMRMFEFCGDNDFDGFLRGMTLVASLARNLLANAPEDMSDEELGLMTDAIADVLDTLPSDVGHYSVN